MVTYFTAINCDFKQHFRTGLHVTGDEPIELLVEVQLHLQYYNQKRSQTHLWYKILRSETLHDLWKDCQGFKTRSALAK